jgi:regulator of sigma E protease
MAATAAEVFTYIGYVIVALIALMVMIVVHELGHYLAGKLLGFKIDEFAIGFGPALFKHTNQKNGEVFTLRPFPIGGFCAFHGEDEDKSDKNAFNNQKAWKRLIVLFSGAFMNFLSAVFIITIYFSAYGQVLPTVLNTYDSHAAQYQNLFEDGDTVLSINGKQVNIMLQEDLTNAFADLDDYGVTFKVLRDGKTVKITADKFYYSPFGDGDLIESINGEKLTTPIPFSELRNGSYHSQTLELVIVRHNDKGEVSSRSSATVFSGVVEDDEDGWYAYGFGITRSLARVRLPFLLAFGRSFGFSFFIVFKILASLGALITGKLALSSAGGTLTVIGTIAQVSQLGFDSFLYVVAVISANLAVMNLLPLPALDGSRMVFTLIEMIFRKPVPRKIEAVIHTVGLILLVLLAVFLDIFHLASR